MEEAATMGATGVLADGTPAPPLPPLLPPPARNDQQHQHQPPKPVSRYRSLRGKSVSSPVRQKGFDIFRDKNDDTEDGGLESPTRNRSQSAASRRRGYAAKEPQPKRPGQQSSQASQTSQTTRTPAPTTNLPLNPKSVNVPSPASSTDRVSQKALRPSKSLNIDRLKSPFRSPPPPPTKDELSKAQPPETDDEARQGKDREEAARWAGEVARLEAETDRILAEQKKRDLARLQAQLAATPSPKPKPKPRRLILDKLSFLSRGSRSNAHSQPSTPKSAPAKIFTSINWSPPSPSSPPPQNMSLLEHGAIDAPASASNGGERVSLALPLNMY